MPFVEILKPLQEKHTELTAVIKNLQIQIDLHKENLRHLEATIRIFDGSTPLLAKKEEKAKIFWHGELSRLIMDALRGKTEGLSTSEVTQAVMGMKGMDLEDKSLVKEIKEQVTRCLSRQKSIGLLDGIKTDGKDFSWSIV
jgi:hypothetical protein